MVNKGFPKFGLSQAGAYVTSLKNYNLPDFILEKVSKECGSDLLEKGHIVDRLQSMNDDALHMLHRIFVECEEDDEGKFANFRFYAYMSSMFHKSEVLTNESIPGNSGKNHRVQVAVKQQGMYTAVAFNKATGNPINRREAVKFYEIADDIKKGEHGTQLTEAVYGSSVGFRNEAQSELKSLSRSRTADAENRLDFKIVNFENNIYSVTRIS